MKKLLIALALVALAASTAEACPGFFGRGCFRGSCGGGYVGGCNSGSCGGSYYQPSCSNGSCGSVYYSNGAYYYYNGYNYVRSVPAQPKPLHGGAQKVVAPAPDARPPYGGAEPAKVTVPAPKPQPKIIQMPSPDQVGPIVN